ncbi:hypothetical protein GQ44DRAFT_729821 [Phaeosphaeriaceae sp. PMI808]|nr:hypothetical protein GQ44DRAFT_729821 [Phaeosphaeriaceae sp. PMI808]
MHFSVLTAATTLAIASITNAWRLDIYQDANFGGDHNTYRGPGREGWACHSVEDLNGDTGTISSLKFYADTEFGGYCCLQLYGSPGCGNGFALSYWTCETKQYKSLGNYNDDISSFATNCFNF